MNRIFTRLTTSLLIIICVNLQLVAQQPAVDTLPRYAKDSAFSYYKRYLQLVDSSLFENPLQHFPDKIDSSLFNKVKKTALPRISIKKSRAADTHQLVKLTNGYINYNWNYRSGVDTPFNYQNISQHHITASADLTLAAVLPLRVTYFERRSNSPFFRDFRDFRVDVNTYELNRLRQGRIREYINNELMSYLNTPDMGGVLKAYASTLDKYKNIFNDVTLQKKLIDAKELVINPELAYAEKIEVQDSLVQEAKDFIAFYERIDSLKQNYQRVYDSLGNEYKEQQQKVKKMRQLSAADLNQPENIAALKKLMDKEGIADSRFTKLMGALSGIKTLSFGRTAPNMSNLTVNRINVKGINLEYNRNNIYAGVTAGSIDFRVRDFLYSGQQRTPQYVYALRLGYGNKEKNNLIATYYEGKKQLFAGVVNSRAQFVRGVSLAGQWVIKRNHRINVEIAQSASPLYVGAIDNTDKKESIDLNDKHSKAYTIQFRSYFPKSQTKVQGMYQYRGVNFQNFSSYRVNATTNSWQAGVEQQLWKRQFQLKAQIQKDDFDNPNVLQRYNANMVFKNITATLRIKNAPVVSFGLMPSSQYTVVDSLVYENRFHALNATASHQYNIGKTANGSSVFMYNRFFNETADSGFVYYNANNYFFNQVFNYDRYTANISITHSENELYKYDVWDIGFLWKVFKQNNIGFGWKINHVSTQTNAKVGYYLNSKMPIRWVGELQFWFERNYLPNLTYQLSKTEFYNISFTRYFK